MSSVGQGKCLVSEPGFTLAHSGNEYKYPQRYRLCQQKWVASSDTQTGLFKHTAGRSKTYRHHRHRAVNSIGRSVGGATRVGVMSVLSPVPGLKRTGTQTPRHQLPQSPVGN